MKRNSTRMFTSECWNEGFLSVRRVVNHQMLGDVCPNAQDAVVSVDAAGRRRGFTRPQPGGGTA